MGISSSSDGLRVRVTRAGRRAAAAACAAVVLGAGPHQAAAQSASQLGAWDALMLSPVGALAPLARDPGPTESRAHELSLRYGRWRYDADDAVHDTMGLTFSPDLGFARTRVTFTGAYLLVECTNCSHWALGGVDVQSSLWNRAFAGAGVRPATAGVGLQASLGGARYGGSESSTATSAAIGIPIGVTWGFVNASTLCASIIPGVGFGRIASSELAESGYRGMIGAAVSWTLTSTFGIHLGMQRVIISGGPTQVGAGLSWKFGSGTGAGAQR